PNTATMDFGAGAFTIEFLVKFQTLATDQTLVNKIAGAASDQLYLVEFDAANAGAGTPAALRFLVRDTTANQNDLSVPVSLTAGQWYRVAAVRAGNTSRLYLEGTLIGTQTAGSNVHTGSGGTAARGKPATVAARVVSGLLVGVRLDTRARTDARSETSATAANDTTTNGA